MRNARRAVVTFGVIALACAAGCAQGKTTEGVGGGEGGSGTVTGSQTTSGGAGGATTGGGTGGTGGQGGSAGGSAGGQGGSGGQTGGAAPVCGDGTVDPGETCDGDPGKTCADLGYSGGIVACTEACTYDLHECSGCGDGVIEQDLGEDCDFDAQGDPLVAATCASLGFPLSGANPGCLPNCLFDIRVCQCGNGELDDMEPCDGAALGGKTCITEGFGSGQLACTPDCDLDLSGCSMCKNGVIDPGEACDGADLGGKTCISLGYGSGQLACTPACALDESGCNPCQNGVIDAGEACDGQNLNGHTCKTEGFGSGQIACTAMCTLNTAGCSLCGNNQINPGETCDDGNTVAGDGCSASCQTEVMACDPDGTYTIVGAPVSYSCCGGLVAVNVSAFLFSNNGASIGSSPSNPVSMTGAPTTCPVGSFNNTGSIPGGCTETYHLTGSFTSANTWTGTYEVQFTGADCDCFGGIFGTPCVNQLFSVNAMR